MGTGNSQKITLRHKSNLTAHEKGREEVFRRYMPSWIFCDSSVHQWQTWCCVIRCHLHCPAKTASSCTRGWAGGLLHTPSIDASLVQKRDKDLSWFNSPWQPSYPTHQPLPSQPSAGESCWCQLYQGKAAAVCKLLSPCLCLPRAREGFTLSPSLCSEEAKSKARHFEEKNLLNVTSPQWRSWSVALPGLSCMADSCSEQSQGGKAEGLRV